MKQHQYRVTVEYLAGHEGNAVQQAPLQFDAPNHDDIFKIIHLVQEKRNLTPEQAMRFVTGLKLMTEVIMEERKHPFFADLNPIVAELMAVVKGKKKTAVEE